MTATRRACRQRLIDQPDGRRGPLNEVAVAAKIAARQLRRGSHNIHRLLGHAVAQRIDAMRERAGLLLTNAGHQ
jgi:hypothetical protein